jgi:hypothetical protein
MQKRHETDCLLFAFIIYLLDVLGQPHRPGPHNGEVLMSALGSRRGKGLAEERLEPLSVMTQQSAEAEL